MQQYIAAFYTSTIYNVIYNRTPRSCRILHTIFRTYLPYRHSSIWPRV